jgi:beta-galactosidase/beta-glucuronidase
VISTRIARRIQATASALAFFSLVVMAAAPIVAAIGKHSNSSRELRSGWRFIKGDHQGAETPEFDDRVWAAVRVPHDWAIAGPFNPAEDGYAGKLPWRGVGWYRDRFTLDHEPQTRVYLDFDGVMAFPKVYINGKLAGEWDYGYTPFRLDATKYVNLNGENTLAVRVDTTRLGTRWYPGAGIYRKVTLETRNPIHISHWSTFVTTPEVREDEAIVELKTEITNDTDQMAKLSLK